MNSVMILFLSVSLASSPVFAETGVSSDAGSLQPGVLPEQFLLTSINRERAAAGLPPVMLNAKLQDAAHQHASQIARASTLSHQLEGEASLPERGSTNGVRFSRITENVAFGPSVTSMHEGLMHSQHHRENILDRQVDTVGISVVEANGSLWVVEDFTSSVKQLSLVEQESRVVDVLREMQVPAEPTHEARVTCSMLSGYVGRRPALTLRYSTDDPSQLPEQVRARVQAQSIHSAGVGACPSQQSRLGFTSYNIAVVLYV